MYYFVKVEEEYTDDRGKIKKNRLQYVVKAHSVTDAEAIIHREFANSSLPFRVTATNETKILDVYE